MNINSYITNLKNNVSKDSDIRFKEFLNNYLLDIEEKLVSERIYITKYYIIISLDNKCGQSIDDIDNIINKLNKLRCIVKRICNKHDIENIIYESINKESVI